VVLLLAALIAAPFLVRSERKLPPALGPAGNGLISTTVDGVLHLIDPERGGATPVRGGVGNDLASAFSPDGTRVAFWSRRAAEPLRLILADVASGTARDITGGMVVFARQPVPPAWSPDGTRLAFSGRENGRLRLYVAAADGSSVEAVTGDEVGPTWPVWSPDGRWIAFRDDPEALERERVGLGVVPAAGGDSIILMRSTIGYGQHFGDDFKGISWSPDSQRLAYTRNGSDSTQELHNLVALIDLEGRERTLTDAEDGAAWPIWSPDGAQLAYRDASGIVVTRADGSSRRRLNTEGLGACRLWRWSPDGTGILASAADCVQPIVVDALGTSVRVIDVPGAESGTPDWQRVAE
jgi:TolB protein